MIAAILALVQEQQSFNLFGEPAGLYPVDSLWKLYGLWAVEEWYPIFWGLQYGIFGIGLLYWGIKGFRGGSPAANVWSYFWFFLILQFFLWPVKPSIAEPVMKAPKEDIETFREARKTLLEKEDKFYKGVPRILIWMMAITDTLVNDMVIRVQSLNGRYLADVDMARLRLIHASPTDTDLSRKSALYVVLCVEPAYAHLTGQQSGQPGFGGGSSEGQLEGSLPHPLDSTLDQHFPNYSTEEWKYRAKSMPDREARFLEDVQGCSELRQQLVSDYQEELDKDIHKDLIEELRRQGVSFTDEQYAGYLVMQAAKVNGQWMRGMRSVISGDAGVQDSVDLMPTDDDDNVAWWGIKTAVNRVYDWGADFVGAVGPRVGMPLIHKMGFETMKMVMPSLYGMSIMFVTVAFVFVTLPMAAGYLKPLGWFLRIYVAISFWPVLTALIYSWQLWFHERDYEGLAAFMGDAGTYPTVVAPLMYAAIPAISAFIVIGATSFSGGGGGGGGGTPAGGKSADGGGKQLSKKAENSVIGAGTGGAKGGASGAAKGAKMGGEIGMAGGPVGAVAGAVVGAGIGLAVGAAGGAAGGALGGSGGGGSGGGGSSGIPGLKSLAGSGGAKNDAPAGESGGGGAAPAAAGEADAAAAAAAA